MAGLFFGDKYENEMKELRRKAAQEPKNLHLQVRIGDLLEKMGKRGDALEVYRKASERYAKGGFLIQAIAINKVILRLNPSQVKIHDQLAELYAKRGMVVEEMIERKVSVVGEAALGKEGQLSIPLFSDLKKEELSRVMEKIQTRHFGKDAIICAEGDPGDSIYIISHGRVSIFRRPSGGEKIRLAELKEGDFFGEFGFFAGAKRQATVEALADTDLLEIVKEDLQKIIQEFPSVSQVLFKFYKERVLENLLAFSSLFKDFSLEERKRILDKFTMEAFPSGALVLEEGAAGDSLYIIKKGELEAFTESPGGETLTLTRMKEGDFFGEISLLTGRPRTASVKALGPVELARLNKKDFDQIAAHHPAVMRTLEEFLSLRLANKIKALGIVRDNPAKEEMV
jgi:cAMP-dependent protein kinase regulator